jgi:hypothetical protein
VFPNLFFKIKNFNIQEYYKKGKKREKRKKREKKKRERRERD